jgi:hypothetical protein
MKEERGHLGRSRERDLIATQLLVERLLLEDELVPLLEIALQLLALLGQRVGLGLGLAELVRDSRVEELPVEKPEHGDDAGQERDLETERLLRQLRDDVLASH